MKFFNGVCILMLFVFGNLLIFKRSKEWKIDHEWSNNEIRRIKEEGYIDKVINQY